jgi:zinc transport system substrate-binding protein
MVSRAACAVLVVTCGVAACGDPPPEREPESAADAPAETTAPLVVYTTNYPLAYFAERIGGERVRVEFPAPPDIDPAYWSPGAEEIVAYQGADLILLNGAGYEAWVARTSLPESNLVNTSAGFEDMYVVAEEAVVHTHGPEGEHEHENVAFTTWLDPVLAIEQARAIRDALAARMPEAETALQDGFEALESDLADIDARLEAWATAQEGQRLLASHPVYQYLARRYDLNLRSVHFEPGEMPSGGAWRDLAAVMQGHAADWMLWEGPPLDETRQRLAADYGVGSVVFAPCDNRPEKGDYLSVMRANVEALEALPAR